MVTCCVLGCKSRSERKESDVSFHSFPNHFIRASWVRATGRPNWKPLQWSRICSKHFEQCCFRKSKANQTLLSPLSVPTLHIHLSQPSCSQRVSTAAKESNTVSEEGDNEQKSTDDSSDEDISTEPDARVEQESQTPAGPADDENSKGILCNICGQEICTDESNKFWYTCVQCVDFDMCCSCEARFKAHATHYVLRIPGPRPLSEVSAVLRRVRSSLALVLPASARAANHEPELLVKSEVKEELPDDPLEDVMGPNARPHASNILEQAILSIDPPLPEHDYAGQHTDTTAGTSTTQSHQLTKRPLSAIHMQKSTKQVQKRPKILASRKQTQTKTKYSQAQTTTPNTKTQYSHTQTLVTTTQTQYSHNQTPATNTQTQHSQAKITTPNTQTTHTQTPASHITQYSHSDTPETLAQIKPDPDAKPHEDDASASEGCGFEVFSHCRLPGSSDKAADSLSFEVSIKGEPLE